MQAKVIEIRVKGDSGIGDELEKALNAFLKGKSGIKIHGTQVQALDIGGPSEAELLVLCTVLHS